MKKYTAKDFIAKRKKEWNKHQDIKQDKELIEMFADYTGRPGNGCIKKELLAHPELMIEMSFVIVNKENKTVPFFFNEVQVEFVIELNNAIEDYKAGRINTIQLMILKGRQQGFTALITAYQLSLCILLKNFKGFTIADKKENAEGILNDKAKFSFNNLPELFKPSAKYNSRNELYFDKLNSSWRIATAEAEEVGRSKTVSFLHSSETAFWKAILTIMAGLGQAITKDAIKIMETTANGFNEFKDYWDKKDNNWRKLFYEWWRTSEYTLNFETKEHEMRFKSRVMQSGDEFYLKLKWLKVKKGLNWNQLYWYLFKYKELGVKLYQEYPCTPQEAFLHTGRKYFDVDKLNLLQISAGEFKIYQKRKDLIFLFEAPIAGESYIIGADVAEGLETGDYSHAKILKLSNLEEVGYIHGHISPDKFGDALVDIAIEYNNAFIGVERNNHGHSVLATIYNYRNYKNIYFETNPVDKKDPESKKLGWSTNAKTKYLMLDELEAAIREDLIGIKDADAITELYAVTADEKGLVNLNGKDRVVALAIAYQMRKYFKNRTIGFMRL